MAIELFCKVTHLKTYDLMYSNTTVLTVFFFFEIIENLGFDKQFYKICFNLNSKRVNVRQFHKISKHY